MASSPRQSTTCNHGLLEDLTFHGSPETTLGVELEFQILDPTTGDLAPGALRILDACEEEGIEGVSGEFLLTMLEIKTGVCRNVAEVRDTLPTQLRRVQRLARSLGYELAVAGTHPFSCSRGDVIFPDPRYRRIQKALGGLPSTEAVFGLHIHVGVPDGDRAVDLVNLLTPYLPHLLALSASSPFWQGIDTGFASARARLFRPSPHAGIPPHFRGWQDFCDYCSVLHEGGVLEATKDLYWDIRPRPHLGTVELRIFDAPTSLSCFLGLTALSHCLVLGALRLLEERPDLGRGDPRQLWLAQENRWQAARYGLQAECMRSPGLERRRLSDDVSALLESLQPVALQCGEADFLNVFQPPDSFESGAARLRRLYRQTGSWQAVLNEMQQGWSDALWEEATSAPVDLAALAAADIGVSARTRSLARGPVEKPGRAAARDRDRPWQTDPDVDPVRTPKVRTGI